MKQQLKYVIIRIKDNEYAILFSTQLTHSIVAYQYRTAVVSAGLANFEDGAFKGCEGESESLTKLLERPIVSRSIDPIIIYKTLLAGPWDYQLPPDSLELLPDVKSKFDDFIVELNKLYYQHIEASSDKN